MTSPAPWMKTEHIASVQNLVHLAGAQHARCLEWSKWVRLGCHHFQTDAKPGEQGYCARRNGADPKNPTELRMPSLSEVPKPTFQFFCLTIFSHLCSKFQRDLKFTSLSRDGDFATRCVRKAMKKYILLN